MEQQGRPGRRPTLSYVTWNKTNFPVPNGSRNLKVMAAIIAQKKLFTGQTQ